MVAPRARRLALLCAGRATIAVDRDNTTHFTGSYTQPIIILSALGPYRTKTVVRTYVIALTVVVREQVAM